jgi:hypothetical protein
MPGWRLEDSLVWKEVPSSLNQKEECQCVVNQEGGPRQLQRAKSQMKTRNKWPKSKRRVDKWAHGWLTWLHKWLPSKCSNQKDARVTHLHLIVPKQKHEAKHLNTWPVYLSPRNKWQFSLLPFQKDVLTLLFRGWPEEDSEFPLSRSIINPWLLYCPLKSTITFIQDHLSPQLPPINDWVWQHAKAGLFPGGRGLLRQAIW